MALRYEDGISRIARGYESPFGDNVPPVASQLPASTQGSATQPTPSLLSLSLLSPAMLKAIDTAVETAVEKGLKTIQEESIKMMHDLFKKMADLENEKATEFKKWFDERLAGMDSRIQRNERVVRGTDDDQTRDIAGDEDAGATGGDSLAPVGGGSSQSHKPSLVSHSTSIAYAMDLTSFIA
ncbi:hypothetical protein SLS60_010476 [Paraconiothyrium brasiliense]|uniref:Uncharacterized protein n=1 Tax=Paraconiothyrium brasiliense TaxID=300254 RepID=A0ABR3QPC8_9PLEO